MGMRQEVSQGLQQFGLHKRKIMAEHGKPSKTIIVIGSTGNGKTTLVNLIAGKPVFKESSHAKSETSHSQVHETEPINGESYRIVDTVGIGDTDRTPEEVFMSLADACCCCRDGLVQVLFVIKGRLTTPEIEAFNLMMNVLLGAEVIRFTTIIFTNQAKFRDPSFVTEFKQKLGTINAGKHIIEKVPMILLVDMPPATGVDEDELVINLRKRQAAREYVLARLRVCEELFKPPSLQAMHDQIGDMVEQHRLKEMAVIRNQELLEELEKQREAGALTQQQVQELTNEMAEIRKQRDKAEEERQALLRAASDRGRGPGLFGAIGHFLDKSLGGCEIS
eukprot:m.26013 g.26013  ORF g.26013 m.26013 type:complete len:335 (-) comp4520_c0_seq1:62-1066(-)